MDSATISAVAALAGLTIGWVTSFGTSSGTEKREKLTTQFDAIGKRNHKKAMNDTAKTETKKPSYLKFLAAIGVTLAVLGRAQKIAVGSN